MNLEKLKDSARKFEQKEDWRKAIEVYLRAIQQIEAGTETSPDFSLYNRVGDLYLKINDTGSAVRSYERAVDLYADQGFFNNAIALCGKILRVNPGRTQTYLKLAQLHARKNVVIEAKRNLIEFLERMNGLGQLDQAFQSIKEFADQFSGSQEIRMMLVELLRAAAREEEALEQLAKLAGDLASRGDAAGGSLGPWTSPAGPPRTTGATSRPGGAPGRGDLIFLDTGIEIPAMPAASVSADPASAIVPPEGLETADTVYQSSPSEPDLILSSSASDLQAAPAVEGLEQPPELDFDVAPDGVVPGLEVEEPPEEIQFEGAPLDELERSEREAVAAMPADGLLGVAEDLELSLAASETDFVEVVEPDLELDMEEPPAPTGGLPLIDPESGSGGLLTEEIAELESRILDDPEDPDLHRELADQLLLGGELTRADEELRLALERYERIEDWVSALGIADRLVALEPATIRHHQKRVELAFRAGERAPLLEAYLSLGDALAESGAAEKALAVFRRVQEHDPENLRALEAIATLTAPPTPSSGSAVRPESDAAVAPNGVAPLAREGVGALPAVPHAGPPPTPEPPRAPAGPALQDDGYVDLGSMVIEPSGPRDTRMRIGREEPRDEDEQREFQEILEQFKRGIDENLETDDYEARYDLGVAFKEMGLLDEAIAEFQKALRAPEGKLRTSEALGTAFYEKGQFPVSEAVLRRAVDTVEGGDEAKIGLLYWLGRALEAQGRDAEAILVYERAMAVDIRFQDLSQRLQRLTAERGS